jgi:exodeoxyribonuclease VII small subunit
LPTETAEPTFEHSLAELEAIVHALEDGQLGLDESLARYEQGVKHLKHCYQLLQAAERKIELLTGVAEDGTPATEPFGDEAAPLAESAGKRRTRKSPRGTGQSQPPLDIDE